MFFHDSYPIKDLMNAIYNRTKELDKPLNYCIWSTTEYDSIVKSVDGGEEIYLDLPGCKKEDISLSIDVDTLCISTKRTRGREETRAFQYSLLNTEIDEITSELEDGVLCIFLPKKKTTNKKQIEVKKR
jgi:HSP20 family molecular chaperone IbpA